ncbi:MAG: DUF4114 domain-containing protein [Proteobacteria bacterium]|nr:DUF4114 domain-containing protein [Pseudomonadota bacterium]
MARIGTIARSTVLLAALFIAFLAGCAGGDETTLQLSYEAIPGVGVELDQGSVDASNATYQQKLQFTQQVFDQLVPDIMAAVGVEALTAESHIMPGGYLLQTNPSMQSRLKIGGEGVETAAKIDQLAAALGHVMYQWSVLVTDFAAADGNTGYAIVLFSDGDLNPDNAHEFFVHASTINDGLGGGYMAFEDQMIFLNLRDSGGVPYSGLQDGSFVSALEQAAASFAGARVTVSESGTVAARFIENNWDNAGAGEHYLALMGDEADIDRLTTLRDSFNQMVTEAAATHGWGRGSQLTAIPRRAHECTMYARIPKWARCRTPIAREGNTFFYRETCIRRRLEQLDACARK